jgi:hypothetical protein
MEMKRIAKEQDRMGKLGPEWFGQKRDLQILMDPPQLQAL